MATSPVKKGKNYEIQVCVNGIRKSATRPTKAACRQWALEMEVELRENKLSGIADKLLSDLLEKYSKSVSVNKKGCYQERLRIDALCRDPIGQVHLKDLTPSCLAEWRDRRLKKVGNSTVLRDWIILSNALNIAIDEWDWLKENPLKKVKRPSTPPSRTRLMSDKEIEMLTYTLGYERDAPLETISSRVGAVLLFALETAMRASEISNLEWRYVDLDKRVAHLPYTKNGFPRDVALSPEAVRILEQVKSDSESVFNLSSWQIDALFRNAKKRCMIQGLRFHDSRHTAITRLASKLHVLDLARMTGHKDLRNLQIYYNLSASDISKKLS